MGVREGGWSSNDGELGDGATNGGDKDEDVGVGVDVAVGADVGADVEGELGVGVAGDEKRLRGFMAG